MRREEKGDLHGGLDVAVMKYGRGNLAVSKAEYERTEYKWMDGSVGLFEISRVGFGNMGNLDVAISPNTCRKNYRLLKKEALEYNRISKLSDFAILR